MRILVFDNQITGHHLEYLHHLMMMAAEHSGDSFIFSVPKQFKEIKDNLEWPFLDNVSYDYLEGEIKPQSNGLFEMLKTSLQLCRLIERLIRRHQIDEVYTNGIMAFVPFASFFIPRRTRLSGIVYQIYLYVDNDSSFLSRILNRLKYTVLSKCRTYKSVFILNS